MYNVSDKKRVLHEELCPYRTDWSRDISRLKHSPSFRRLQGKTQLFPGSESDFFRNRLTHSLEVGQIAKSIATKINVDLKTNRKAKYAIDLDLVEFAGLAHDLGHPPFGHIGEHKLDELMKDHGGFEGNAQTLRLLARIEKKKILIPEKLNKTVSLSELRNEYGTYQYLEDNIPQNLDCRIGLNLTYRSLASILKYPNKIPLDSAGRKELPHNFKYKSGDLVKGYYTSEADLIDQIIKSVTNGKSYTGDFKTVECQIMDFADDIAYSTFDLEDTIKAGFIKPFDILHPDSELLNAVATKVKSKFYKSKTLENVKEITKRHIVDLFKGILLNEDHIKQLRHLIVDENVNDEVLNDLINYYSNVSYTASNNVSENGYRRVELTSYLVNEFITGIQFDLNEDIPALSKVSMEESVACKLEIIKQFIYQSQILSPRLKIVDFRGRQIVEYIFEKLIDDNHSQLLPKDYRIISKNLNHTGKMRIVCDFISGMTDRYAIEFYGRLTSENPETIFKPF